jgi:hypothetical protein
LTVDDPQSSLPGTQDRSIPLGRANLLTLGFALPPALALWTLYAWLHPGDGLGRVLVELPRLAGLLAAIVGAIPVHEGLHALGWAAFGRVSLRRVRFGLALRTLNPYAHLLDPIQARAYRWGTALPGLVLGALPCLAVLAWGSAWWMLFSLTMIFAAAGDALVLWLLCGVDPEAMVLDHPSRAGCLVLSETIPPNTPS